MRIWSKLENDKFAMERNVQGEHERNIYTVDWSEIANTGSGMILTGSGDNKIRLFVEQADNSWTCAQTIEMKADINSGNQAYPKI